MVIRKFNELSENYQKLQGSYKERTASYISMKKGIILSTRVRRKRRIQILN